MTTYTEAAPGTPPPPEIPPPAEPARPRARAAWAPVPQVNLLPPEIMADRRFRMLQRRLVIGGVAVVALCAAAVVWAQLGVSGAQSDLAAIQAQGTALRAQQAKYAGVPLTLAELDRVKAAREAALGSDVAWYRFLSDLAINTPPDTELSSVVITMSGKTTLTAATDPLSPAGLGVVKVTGQAVRFTDVAAWLDAVDQVHGLAGSGLQLASKSDGAAGAGADSTSSGSGSSASSSASGSSTGTAVSSDPVSFTGTAVVVPAALSHRYDRKAD
jgi:type IV pilus assembly protein PilN